LGSWRKTPEGESMIKTEKIILPQEGFVKLATILKIIPISTSTWHDGVRKGLFIKPIKVGYRSSFYAVQDVRALIIAIESGDYFNT